MKKILTIIAATAILAACAKQPEGPNVTVTETGVTVEGPEIDNISKEQVSPRDENVKPK